MKCPTCHTEIGEWTDDPILTPKGLSGEEYIGFIEPLGKHITELQDRCKVYENDYDVEPKTTFSEITPNLSKVCFQHVTQLRESIEKISKTMAESEGYYLSKTALLYNYFNYDNNGEYIASEFGDKIDWTDSDLGIDNKQIKIKAIHIEDLRHPIFQYKPIDPIQHTNCYYADIRFYTFYCWERLREMGYDFPDECVKPDNWFAILSYKTGYTCPIGKENECLGTTIRLYDFEPTPWTDPGNPAAGYFKPIYNASPNKFQECADVGWKPPTTIVGQLGDTIYVIHPDDIICYISK